MISGSFDFFLGSASCGASASAKANLHPEMGRR
jgi:hypothetical protein